ncbi:phage tail tube protein [Pseudescherichia vulneris]
MPGLFPTAIERVVAIVKESTYGVAPDGVTPAQIMRRTKFGITLSADNYTSNEINSTGQVNGIRIGSRKVEGPISCELSPGTYNDLWAAILRSVWQGGDQSQGTPGILFIPEKPDSNDSFTVEVWDPGISGSSIYTGCRVTKADVSCPATGNVTVEFTFTGQNMVTGDEQTFTTLTPASKSEIFAAVSGSLLGFSPDAPDVTQAVADITAFNFTIDANASTQAVVGSNLTPDVFIGRISVSGSFSAIYKNNLWRKSFTDETPFGLSLRFNTDNSVDADYMVFDFPYIKLGSVSDDEGEQSITQQCNFTALMNPLPEMYGPSSSTIMISDSTILGGASVPMTGATVDVDATSATVGEVFTAAATVAVTPSNASGITITYALSGAGAAGLSVDASGAISGTPTAAGNAVLTATVQDDSQNTETPTATIIVAAS